VGKIQHRFSGFTIVELVVVIAVIGILAGITVVGYGAWQAQTAQNAVKSDLTNLLGAMENARNFGSGYPLAVPSTFTPSNNVQSTTVSTTSSGDYFCASMASAKDATKIFNINSETKEVKSGACLNLANVTVAKGLIGWWRFNNNMQDASQYGNDGTGVGASPTTGQNGVGSNAYNFNGTSSYIALPTTLQRPTDSITISLWLKPSSVLNSRYHKIIGSTQSGGYGMNLEPTTSTNCPSQVTFQVYINGTYESACAGVTATQDVWLHAVGVYDGSSVKLYTNGVLAQITKVTGAMTYGASTVPTCLGNDPNSTNCAADTYFYAGALDDVRIYSRALSPSEVSAIYAANAR